VTLEISVRRAQLDDLSAIVELRLALLREYRDHPLYGNLQPDVEDRARNLYRTQLTSFHDTIFVAEIGRRIVGVMRCVDTPSSPLFFPERYCYVSSVYVRPADRRKGVLRALLGAADRWCQEQGISEMRLHNSATAVVAEQAWSALGFEIVEHVRRRPLDAAGAAGVAHAAVASADPHPATR
jgi:GNAT superfamily N-acetyltransferase